MTRTLTHEEAKAFYDGFGFKQDQQAFYEEVALQALLANASLDNARSVVEFGCGTGRLALELLHRLPDDARYLGTDISSTMIAIAGERLASYDSRATVVLAGGPPVLPVEDASVDRVVSTYVFDLLSEDGRKQFLAEAARVLRPGGLLCLAGITNGKSPISRAVMSGWQWVFALNPRWVGGCRPTRTAGYLSEESWQIRYHHVFVSWGIASEVVVASLRTADVNV